MIIYENSAPNLDLILKYIFILLFRRYIFVKCLKTK